MLPEDRIRFGPVFADLKDCRRVALRILLPSDGEAVADFYESVPRKDFRFYAPHALTREEGHRTAGRADAPRFVCVVGVGESGEIVGYGWYDWREPDSPLSSFGICVRTTHQGSGLGRALLGRALEIGRTVGPPRMCLTVQKANARAFALYSSMGFHVVREQMVGERWGFAPEPEYYMERDVREGSLT